MHKSIFTPALKSVSLLLIVAALCSFSKSKPAVHQPKQNLADTSLNARFESFYRYMAKTMRYPKVAREGQVTGRIIAFVEINDAGQVSSAKIWRGIGNGCDEEVVNTIRTYKDKLPMAKAGVYLLPVSFLLDDSNPLPLDSQFKDAPNCLGEIVIRGFYRTVR